MKLDVKSAAAADAVVWGGWAIFLTGVANLIWPDYGQAFLEMMASVYPWYQATASFGQVLIGTLYGVVDGAVIGAIFAWLYNVCASRLMASA